MKQTVKRLVSGVAGLALAGGAFMVGALPAHAAPVTLDDASFHWSMNEEAGGGAFFGGANWLVAGEVPDVQGKAGVWNNEHGAKYFKATEGNVTITRPTYDSATDKHNFDDQVPVTWEHRNSKSPTELKPVLGTQMGSTSWNQANIAGGKGWVDPEAESAEIQWTGSYTVVFYGGMTYWSINDPKLTVTNGEGKVTARLSGFGADMYDLTKWIKLEDKPGATIATLKNVDVTPGGIRVTPEYRGVEVNTEGASGASNPQKREGDNWGSFPQDFIDFSFLTGQGSYWYSSGGQVDPRKPASPITIKYDATPAKPEPQPQPDKPADRPDCTVGGVIGDDGVKLCVDVAVPEKPDKEDTGPVAPTGEFRWSVAENAGVVLGNSAYNEAGGVSAQGDLPVVTVTDTRSNSGGWSVNGVASDFKAAAGDASFAAAALGWVPKANVEGIAGPGVDPNNPGLVSTTLLGSSNKATGEAGVQLQAKLNLNVLKDNVPAPGNYRSTLTLTTIAQ